MGGVIRACAPFVALLLLPANALAQVSVLSPGTRSVGTSVCAVSYEAAGCAGIVDQDAANSSLMGDYQVTRSSTDNGQVLGLASLNTATTSTAVSASAALLARAPSLLSGASAGHSGYTFHVSTPTTAHIQALFSLKTNQIVGWDGASVGLQSGVWNGNGLSGGASLAQAYWSPAAPNSTNWAPGVVFDRTLTLPPGDYGFGWSAGLSQGGNPRFGYEPGNGAMKFNVAMVLTPGAASSSCLSINGSTSPVALGSVLQFAADCCGSATAAVPAAPLAWNWLLAALLLLGALSIFNKRTRWGVLLIPTVLMGERGAGAAVCPGTLTWEARSSAEVFSGNGTTFSFQPTMAGVFTVSLSSAAETAIKIVEVTGESCELATNGTICGANQKCMNGVCVPFTLMGACCSAQIQNEHTLGLSITTGASANALGCADRTVCDWPGGCTSTPTSGLPVFAAPNCYRGTTQPETIAGSNNADVLIGYDGNDTFSALQGDDSIFGDLGDDEIHGGRGNDCLRGGKGNDNLLGEIDNDRLFGDRGNDTLRGGDGDDIYIYDAQNLNPAGCGQPASSESDGDDKLVDETNGNDTVFFLDAGTADLCLDRTGDDLIARYCQGTFPAGSVTAPGYFASNPTNQFENIKMTGN